MPAAARLFPERLMPTKTLKQLDVSAREIGEVLEIIKEISEQTNLLALNATIELPGPVNPEKDFPLWPMKLKAWRVRHQKPLKR